jgi:hypothetical protein
MTLKGDLPGVIEQIAGRPMKLQIKIGQVAARSSASSLPSGAAAAASSGNAGDDEVRQRALSHPDVQRFQEIFPQGQVRQVRNLRD